MLTQILFYLHSALLLLFGVFISAAFCGIKFTSKNIGILTAFSAVSGVLQIIFLLLFSEEVVWKIYPLVSHLPLFLLLFFVYKKSASTSVVSICTAYLCCQPAKIVKIFTEDILKSSAAIDAAQIITLICVFLILFFRLSEYISKIFNKDPRSILIFGITPISYYVFDYFTVIYTDLWTSHIYKASEFLSFMLCIIFLVFCLIYHKEYEQKADAQRNEQIIRIALEQQKKEIESVKRSEHEIRIIRHDMRFFLSNLSACIENDDKTNAKKMISSYVENIDSTVVKKYCQNSAVNYILSNFSEKCRESKIQFTCQIEAEPTCDETLFSSIISNALDNALNAQKYLSPEDRNITLVLKKRNEKLLLSVKNNFDKSPVFVDGIPISDKKGHGYGTQSIVYLTERMGGNCRFAIEDNEFVLMVVI